MVKSVGSVYHYCQPRSCPWNKRFGFVGASTPRPTQGYQRKDFGLGGATQQNAAFGGRAEGKETVFTTP